MKKMMMMLVLKVKEISDQIEHVISKEDHDKGKGDDDNTKGHSHDEDTTKTSITPLTCTYQRGSRQVFAASKRQGTLSSTSAQRLDNGMENMGKGKKGKKGKKTTQNPRCIDLDNDNEDKEMATRLLLQTKDAQSKS